MDEKKLYLTPEGAAKLRADPKELTGPGRTALADRLHHAVRQGDLSENADYIAAKEDQAFLEGRILELETILRQAVIVEGQGPVGVVDLGSQVRVSGDGGAGDAVVRGRAVPALAAGAYSAGESPIGSAL